MSKRHNHAGRQYVADRFIELNPKSENNAVTRITSSISQQIQRQDIENLRDELDKISSDGIISVSEKEGLRREWASLQQTYSSINEQFSSNSDISDNPSFLALKEVYATLSALMSKILDDMTTDYVGEDAKQISSLFTSVYSYLTLCQSVLNAIDEFTKAYTLSVIGNRDILDGTTLTAGIYREGVEQQNPEFINGNNYTWSRLDTPDSYTPKNGKSIVVNMDDLPVSPCRFSLVWKNESEETPESLSIILELRWGVIKQYAWSNALTESELEGMMPSSWSETKPDKPSDRLYLWRRESSDNGETWVYFRETGQQGSQGWSTAQVSLYKRSAEQPEPFDGEAVTYYFATAALSGDIGTWSKTIPTGDSPLYVIYASAFAQTESDVIQPNEWTTPAILSEKGTDGEQGYSVATIVLYQRGDTAPEKPSGIVSYSFVSHQLTGIGSWHASVPDGTKPVWAISATAISRGDSDTIDPSEWSSPVKVYQDGEKGDQGDQGEPGVSIVSIKALYAIGDSATEPPNEDFSTWSETRLSRPEGMYLWVCDRITYSDGVIEYTEPFMASGDKGDAGTAPEYWYKYTKTNEPDAWKDGVKTILLHGKLLAIHGKVLTVGTSKWYDHVPEGEQYKNDFLWTKIIHADGTVDIIPPAQQGAPAKDIRIIASQSSYQLTTRGIVQADTDFVFTLERNYVDGIAAWSMDPPSGTNDEISGAVDAENPDIFRVHLAKGSTIQSFLVSVQCEGYDIIRSLRINGVDGGEETAYYFGVYPKEEDAPLPSYYKLTDKLVLGESKWPDEVQGEGELINGDYIIYKTKVYESEGSSEYNIEPIPYYWNGKEWIMLDEDSPYYSQTMGNILGDMVSMPDTPVTVKGVYAFFQHLATYNAFITNLFSQYIKIQQGGAIYAGSFSKEGVSTGETKGFHLSADGVLQAVEAILMKASVTGSFYCQDEIGRIFYTALASTAKTLQCSSKTRWSFKDFLDSVNLPLSVTYNGGTYTAERFSASVRAVSSLTGDVDEATFTAPFSATYRFGITIRYDGYVTIKRNGVTVYDSQDHTGGNEIYSGNTTIYLDKGDTVALYADALGTGDTSASVASCNATLERGAVFFSQDGEVKHVFYDDTDYFIANALSTAGFNSASNLRYASINGWFSNMTAVDTNIPVATDTEISVDDTDYIITTAVKRTDSFSVLTSEGVYLTFEAPSDTGEFATKGWYNIEGDIPLMNNNRGIYSASLFPISPGSTNIGDDNNHFGTGYINVVRSLQMYGDVNSEDTRNTYKVWGAVAN